MGQALSIQVTEATCQCLEYQLNAPGPFEQQAWSLYGGPPKTPENTTLRAPKAK